MKIEASTVFTEANVLRFQIFNIRKGNKYIDLISQGILILGISICIVYMTFVKYDPVIFMALICLLMMAGFLYYMRKSMPKSFIKASKEIIGARNDFVFEDENFNVTSASAEKKGESVYSYEDINRVYETDGYFYIYVSKRKALIVDKNGIAGGKTKELRDTFLKKLPPKRFCDRRRKIK